MLYIYCPFCKEKRDEQEFHYAGEAFIERPKNPEELTDEQWGDYVFMRSNHKGWIWEQWEHTSGCRKLFVVKRNNVTNEIEGSYTFAEARAEFERQQAAEKTQNAQQGEAS